MNTNGRLSFKYRSTKCLNCDHPLDISDKYCPNCAQLNSTKKLKLLDLFDEFFASIFSYDSKFRETLKALIFSPGKITKEFVAGRRMTYTNPFRFYLSVSIIFFLFQGFLIKMESFTDIDYTNTQTANNAPNLLFGNAARKIDSLRPQKNLDTILKNAKTDQELAAMPFTTRTIEKVNYYSDYYDLKQQHNIDSAFIEMKHEPTFWNRFIYKKVVDAKHVTDEPKRFFDFMRSVLPAIAFFFLPVFAFVIWLIYSKKKYTYMDHLVFTFHTQTMFFFLLFIIAVVGIFFNPAFVSFLLIVFFGFYLYKALRKFYAQGRFITIVKFVFLNSVLLFLLIFGSIFAFIGSFLLY